MGVAALVLGIISTLLALNPFIFFIAVPLGILALVLGIVGRKAALANHTQAGPATAGMILGIVACCVSLMLVLFCSMVIRSAKKAVDETISKPIQEAIEKAKKDPEFDEAFKKAMEDAAKRQQK